MGSVISKLRGKQSNTELLEGIQQDIQKIEGYRLSTHMEQKKILGGLVLYSAAFYVIGAIVSYIYYLPANAKDHIIYGAQLVIFPLLIWLVRCLIIWYYNYKITVNEEKLLALKREKSLLLEKIKETESFKVVRELMMKYAPEQLQNISGFQTPVQAAPGMDVRRRATSMVTPVARQIAVAPPYSSSGSPRVANSPRQLHRPAVTNMPSSVPGPNRMLPAPRPIFPKQRTSFDKLVEYFVGESPATKYALICRHCHSHNGMALSEEFEYLAFRCCYCYCANPARKLRPLAPTLERSKPVNLPEGPTSPESIEKRSYEASSEDHGGAEGDEVVNASLEIGAACSSIPEEIDTENKVSNKEPDNRDWESKSSTTEPDNIASSMKVINEEKEIVS